VYSLLGNMPSIPNTTSTSVYHDSWHELVSCWWQRPKREKEGGGLFELVRNCLDIHAIEFTSYGSLEMQSQQPLVVAIHGHHYDCVDNYTLPWQPTCIASPRRNPWLPCLNSREDCSGIPEHRPM
jgi:hypothetical protein